MVIVGHSPDHSVFFLVIWDNLETGIVELVLEASVDIVLAGRLLLDGSIFHGKLFVEDGEGGGSADTVGGGHTANQPTVWIVGEVKVGGRPMIEEDVAGYAGAANNQAVVTFFPDYFLFRLEVGAVVTQEDIDRSPGDGR